MIRTVTGHIVSILLISSFIRNTLQIKSSLPPVIGFRYSTFQEGVICNAAQRPLNPTTLGELQEIVLNGLWNNYSLKAVGRLHSETDIICTDGVPINMQGINHFRYDKEIGLATIGAGATMGTFLDHLHENGRTMHGIPTYSDISVGGALGTGAHGTSFSNPASLSDQLVGVVIVDGLGNVRNVTDSETISAFRTHLGLLGIVYELTLSTIPQYKLHIQSYPVADSILWTKGKVYQLAKSNERLQLFWFPTAKTVVVSKGNRVPLSTPGNCQTYFISEASRATTEPLAEALEAMQASMNHLGYFTLQGINKLSMYQKAPGRTPIFTQNGQKLCDPAIGFSHRMSGNRCIQCAWHHGNASVYDFEYAVVIPWAEFEGAVKSISAILAEYPMEFPLLTGIYFRFLPPSDGLLTMNSDQASVAIEWVVVPRRDRFNKGMLGLASSQAMMQALTFQHGARSHWGKNGPFYTLQPLLRERFPHLPTFIKHMEDFDPHGVFLNDFGRRLRFGSVKSSLDSYAKHCALVDSCVCERDEDCGDGRPGSYLCDVVQEYRVCKENPGDDNAFRGRVLRKLIDTMKQR